jgi:hypothetical protein
VREAMEKSAQQSAWCRVNISEGFPCFSSEAKFRADGRQYTIESFPVFQKLFWAFLLVKLTNMFLSPTVVLLSPFLSISRLSLALDM